MIAVVDDVSDEAVWWLVSDTFTEVLLRCASEEPRAGHPEGTDPAAYSEQLVAPGVGPIALGAAGGAEHHLQSLRYGSVPNGFRQALPPRGGPAPLVTGRRYTVTVLGGGGVVIGLGWFVV